jgi:hypothetical protein
VEQGTDEGNPFLERPDEHAETGDELYCWMPSNDHRECNGACVAYDERALQDPRVDPCKVLNAIRQIGGSVAAAAKTLTSATTLKQKEDDAVRGERLQDAIDRIPGAPEVKS